MNKGDGYHGWSRKWLRKCLVYVFRVGLDMPIVCLTEALKAIEWWKIQVNFYLCSVVQSLGKKQSWLKVLTVILDTEKLFLCQVYLTFFFFFFFPPMNKSNHHRKYSNPKHETRNLFLGKCAFSTT